MIKNQTQRSFLGRVALAAMVVLIIGTIFGCQRSEGESAPETSSTTSTKSPAESPKPRTSPQPAENAAFDFALLNLQGETVHLSDFRGRVVMIDFWGTWCGPCRRTIPDLIALHQTHNATGFDVVGVALERRKLEEGLIPFLQQNQIPYPILIGTREVVEGYGGIKSVPTAFLIGRDGTIRHRFVGVTPRATLEKAIVDLLAEPPPA